MSKIIWDKAEDRIYETGVDHGVLYVSDGAGGYKPGVAWNGLTSVSESPSGAEASPQYADNIKYLNLVGPEEFGGTIESFTYPDEFMECDGSASPTPGLVLGQQSRKQFGLSYRTKVGNAAEGQDFGYKIHIVYNALAAPSEKAYATVNDSPEAMTFSWELTTSAVTVVGHKPVASLTINSVTVDDAKLAALEKILYGVDADPEAEPPVVAATPRLPLPDEIISLLS